MDLTGQVLAHYRLVAKLGEGGMGSVYRAEDVRLGRHIALKLLPPQSAMDAKVRERFLAEARAVSALEHPHICMLYEFDDRGEQPFLAMQLVEGETLKHAILRGPLEEARVREVLAAVGGALDAAHARGIVHRDVKSDNILLGREGAIKLTDFGIARLAERTGLTATTTILGTATYMAPEQILGEPATPMSDQFALAVVAYECLTGVLPFDGAQMAAVFYAIVNAEPAPVSSRRPDLDPAWEAALARAMAKAPGERFASMGEFVRALGGGSASPSTGMGAATGAFAAPAPAAVAPPAQVLPPAASITLPHMVGAPWKTGEARPEATASSVAVLPFVNQSGNSESDYFCEGIGDDIRTDLSKIPGLQVPSSHAVARYRGERPEAARVAAELNVRSVVAGTVRRAKDRVRINVELTDAATGYLTWAERFDRTLDDVFEVQEEIVHAIVTALRGALTPHEAAELLRERPTEVAAYDLYLRGRDFYRRYTREDNRRALECFEQAVAVDEGYALAWAGIADCCAQMNDKDWDKDPALLDRGYAAARRAVELDPKLAEGHKAEALIWRVRRDRMRSVDALHRALAANPTFIPALINLGHELLIDGDFSGGERALRRAIAADSAYGFSYIMLALVAIYTRRYGEAVQLCHRAQVAGESPFFATYAHALRAQAYLESGDAANAAREVQAGRAASLPDGILTAVEGMIAAATGDAATADASIEKLLDHPPGESSGCELAACTAGRRGRAAEVVRFLEAAERIDPRHPASWRISPSLSPIRDEPVFVDFIGERGRQLVWPTQAPPLPEEERANFYVYREESARPRPDAMP